jgi:hypothetical protein
VKVEPELKSMPGLSAGGISREIVPGSRIRNEKR